MNEFAVLSINYYHRIDSFFVLITTNNPCHLTCYYTDKPPRRHRDSRILRGAALPWGAYFCFVSWLTTPQIEAGDTYVHTFNIPDCSKCQTRYFCFKGTVADSPSPSVSPIFTHHHPGVTPHFTALQVSTNFDDYRRVTPIVYQACPVLCPPVLRAGSQTGQDQGMGLRFLGVPIPHLAVILDAHLVITSSRNQSAACGTRISAEDVDNPGDFSADNYASATARWLNRTWQRVDWDFTPADVWVLNTAYRSPDITAVIQELIDRPGWVEANAMAIFWNDWDGRTLPFSNWRETYPYWKDSARAVQLWIEYGF